MENTYKYFIRIVSIFMLTIVLIQCKKESTVSPVPIIPIVIKEATDVNKFIYNGLKDYYLWVDQVPSLIAPKYAVKDSLNAFLNTYTDPNNLFTSLLYKYHTVDKWSFIVDDSKVIDNWIQGISETMGFDFMLARIGTSDNVFGFIRYVYKGSPAEKAGIKRGDLFMQVDDQQLTVTNYQTLLFTKMTYKLSFAAVSANTISLNGKSVTMTAVLMQENPIQLDTVLNVGNLKVGYLVYNGFNADYDIELNDVFKRFKDAAIDRLVLDLRYNGGGSVQTAKYLASMIYGTATTKVFLKSQYNTGLQEYIVSTEGAASLIEDFTDKILKTSITAETPINTINMSKLYVITSDNTASASELLINGLKPYMPIVNVGDSTVGKYVASFTIKDWDSLGVVNPNNNWAMQPIVVKMANSQGVSDYVLGLFPDIQQEEDIAKLLPFGDQNETLLKAVLDNIKGLPQTAITLKSQKIGLKKVFDAQDNRPFAKQMYINQLKRN
ncbi:MAG TPA: S41 family peptidase [Prolixibacteraceae bacterium]|nr:S41 family peptidase [Prolixibacteraceae bacterium]